MISIRKSVSDLDRLAELEKRDELCSAVLDSYAFAMDSAAHYIIEVDAALAIELRGHLKAIESQVHTISTVDQIRTTQSSFRGELREYHNKSTQQLEKMRKDVASATAAMQIFAETVAANGINHEEEVSAQLKHLRAVASSNTIEEIRTGIATAVEEIDTSITQMRQGNQLMVAQLQDEIRLLHKQIEIERRSIYTDRTSGAWNRQKIDTHLDNFLRQDQPFCLLMVWIRNLKRLESQYSRTVLEGTLRAMINRFGPLLPDDAMIGRWSDDQFVAVLDLPQGTAVSLASEVSRKLAGSYSIQENGLAQRVLLQATAGIIERPAGASPSKFHENLQRLAGAVSGA